MKEMNEKDIVLLLRHETWDNVSGLARVTLVAHSNKNSLSTSKGTPRRDIYVHVYIHIENP